MRETKYGLPTAIAMVVGIVIGSGVFFKAEHVLNATGGDLSTGIIAWLIGGLVMMICAAMFSVFAVEYESADGLLGYIERVVGARYSYYTGWFLTTVYTPAITSVLAWVSARYTCVLLDLPTEGGECMTLAAFFLIAVYAVNMLAPLWAGRLQVSVTVVKLIPLIAMGIVGFFMGLSNGMTARNFAWTAHTNTTDHALFTAVVSTVFAYEGWIVATSIHAELKNARRNMPLALTGGALIVVAVYLLYYIGLAGVVPNETMMQSGEEGALLAFETLFGALGHILFVFVILSCLGTLNGMMMGCVRGLYILAQRGQGPNPSLFAQIDPVVQMPLHSGVFGLVLCGIWLLFFYGSNLGQQWFGRIGFDSSELPIVGLYMLYIPLFFLFMVKHKTGSPVIRFVLPSLSIVCCILVLIAACFAHGTEVLVFAATAACFLLVGAWFERKNKRKD